MSRPKSSAGTAEGREWAHRLICIHCPNCLRVVNSIHDSRSSEAVRVVSEAVSSGHIVALKPPDAAAVSKHTGWCKWSATTKPAGPVCAYSTVCGCLIAILPMLSGDADDVVMGAVREGYAVVARRACDVGNPGHVAGCKTILGMPPGRVEGSRNARK